MISILLPTYNGEKFIVELIDSILAQSVKEFRLYILDDRSSDNTFSIACEYARRYPGMIIAEQNEVNTGGAKQNFMRLMMRTRDDYIMLCDQDDIWLDDKIELSLERMIEMENTYDSSTPILVHTDLTVTDESLQIISDSYKSMANIDFGFNRLNNLVAMNIPTGCTIMYNRALSMLITVQPDFFVMHDWWVSLIAASFGEIGYVDAPTVLYRQHERNSIGAKRVLSLEYVRYVLSNINVMAEKLDNSYRQARSFLKIYSDDLNGVQMELFSAHGLMNRRSKFGKLCTMIRYNTFLYSVARKVGQVIVILLS
ncbi:MAG: glycosyltransferase family 2 protein [Oscillospiraceae bacterium]|nr:glycosyltransferase family 2 protein [Oscillospiraceae bacterium]MCL2278578.1 glycosyltransferase family 2 protein [Oscillospiraceae bacterium]